mmetsp:Transcript_28644/g.65730  ORF Transcript_28644/g.65730 Transcript_28644/m.65730 type:complete len:158 (-) Transcript_28644:81-554(-)
MAAAQSLKTGAQGFNVAHAAGATQNWYGAVDPRALTTLDEMVKADGHSGIEVLKVDCEGCEWAAFEQMARDSPGLLARTSVVTVELHLSPSLIAPTPEQFVALFDFLVEKLGMKLWYLRNNPGFKRDRQVVDFLAKQGAKPDQCCYELAFYRPPPAV